MADEQVQEGYAQQGHTPKGIDWIGWRSFVLAMLALAIALILALYSSSAAETGRIWLAGVSALAALAIAGWVALTIVPVLARRTSLHWFPQIDYRLTREGISACAAEAPMNSPDPSCTRKPPSGLRANKSDGLPLARPGNERCITQAAPV